MGEARRKLQSNEKENAMLIGGRSCHSCEFRYKIARSVFCTRYPPQAYLAPGPQGQPQLSASYPPVNPAIPCGEYRRNEAFAVADLNGGDDVVQGEPRRMPS
jgi:hypothetical protein